MPRRFFWFLILATLLSSGGPLPAASVEDRAFTAASEAFHGEFWERAERAFGEFTAQFPKSPRVSEAVLYQAEARFKLGAYAGAVALLSTNQAQAGLWADEYAYWAAQAQLQNDEPAAAAAGFARLIREFPHSSHLLEACVTEASAYARLAQWPRVIAVLQDAGGPFPAAASANATNGAVVEGELLLGEAQWRQRDFAGATETLALLAPRKLQPELDWRRWHLQCQVEWADGRADEALRSVTNLLALAAAVNRSDWRSEGISLHAQLLEQAGDPVGAVAAYQLNLATNAPPESQRRALLKIAELSLTQGEITNAVRTLDQFLREFPNSGVADLTWMTLGELQLRQFVSASGTNATNFLRLAAVRFDELLEHFPASPLVGKAFLNQGWCFWLQEQFAPSAESFRRAVAALPPSTEQAVARFKWADAQFRLQDFAGAEANYQALITEYAAWPEVKTNYLEPALYQLARVALAAGDADAATGALRQILDWYPNGFAGDHALLLVGQGMARQGDARRARELFAEFERRYPASPLLAEVRLAIARCLEQERDWPSAAENYAEWIGAYTNHAGLPRAEFSYAWDQYMAGRETNALVAFTNFVAQFSTNELAPRAQWWLGDYFFRQGDFKSAEANYQLVFQNWPSSDLTYAARMMAGRAAVARLNYNDAIGYFTNLTSDPRCPDPLYAQALFAYGDAVMNVNSDATNRLADLTEAIRIFAKITATNELAAPALGRMGDCYLQMAAGDTKYYAAASNAYQQAVTAPGASVAVRSQAKVGLGATAEKEAQVRGTGEPTRLLKLALDEYLDVLFSQDLRAGEKPDPFWTRKAGLEAARLAEALQQWAQAIKVYQALQEALPPLHDALEKKIARAREHLQPEKASNSG